MGFENMALKSYVKESFRRWRWRERGKDHGRDGKTAVRQKEMPCDAEAKATFVIIY